MENRIRRHMHHVVVFTNTQMPGKQAAAYSYIAPKVRMARKWFKEEHPDRPILKIFSVGAKEYSVDAEKYYALYEES